MTTAAQQSALNWMIYAEAKQNYQDKDRAPWSAGTH